jgi:hypothetical protein
VNPDEPDTGLSDQRFDVLAMVAALKSGAERAPRAQDSPRRDYQIPPGAPPALFNSRRRSPTFRGTAR